MRKLVFVSIFSLGVFLFMLFLFCFTPRLILRGLPIYLARLAPEIQLASFTIGGQALSFDGQLILKHPDLIFNDGQYDYHFAAEKLVIPHLWHILFGDSHYHFILDDLNLAGPFFELRAPESRLYLVISEGTLEGQGFFREAKLTFFGLPMTGAAGELKQIEQRLTLCDLTGFLSEAQIRGRLSVDQFQPIHGSLSLTLSDLNPVSIQGIPELLRQINISSKAEIQFEGTIQKIDSLALLLDLPSGVSLKRGFLEEWLRDTGLDAIKAKIRSLLDDDRPLKADRAVFLLRDADHMPPILNLEIVSQSEQIFASEDFALDRVEDASAGFFHYEYRIRLKEETASPLGMANKE